jgi:hypothetical protein
MSQILFMCICIVEKFSRVIPEPPQKWGRKGRGMEEGRGEREDRDGKGGKER